MEEIKISFSDNTYREISQQAEEEGIPPHEVVRNLVHKGIAYEELEKEIDGIAKRQKRRSEVSEKLRDEIKADLPTKMKWALFGKDND